jgi:hypothetical protein
MAVCFRYYSLRICMSVSYSLGLSSRQDFLIRGLHLSVVICTYQGSRDGVVGIATRYGREGPGIESRPVPRPTQYRTVYSNKI